MIVFNLVSSIFYFVLLSFISFFDLKKRIIPNKLLFGMIAFRVLSFFWLFLMPNSNAFAEVGSSLFAILISSVATLIFYPKFCDQIGAGDFKLLIVAGFCFGVKLFLFTLAVVFALLLVVLVFQGFGKRKGNIPFAPFLCFGFLISLVIDFLS